jgi:hypothetical protein
MTQHLTSRVLPAIAAGALVLAVFTPTSADAQWRWDYPATWGYSPYYATPYYAPPPVYYRSPAYYYGYGYGPGYDFPYRYYGWNSQYSSVYNGN